MLSKRDAELILEFMRARAAHALDSLTAQEIEALITLEVDSLVNADDREALRFEGVLWSTAEE